MASESIVLTTASFFIVQVKWESISQGIYLANHLSSEGLTKGQGRLKRLCEEGSPRSDPRDGLKGSGASQHLNCDPPAQARLLQTKARAEPESTPPLLQQNRCTLKIKVSC